MVTIPLRNLPEYGFEVTLENVPYQFTVKWNVRAAQYTLNISSRDGTQLVGCLGLALNSEMLKNHAGLGLPPGTLTLIDPSGGTADVGINDLEDRCRLIYQTGAEFAAL